MRAGVARVKGDRYLRRAEDEPGRVGLRQAGARDDLALGDAALAAAPDRRARGEKDVDAVVVFTVPMAHFRGIPTYAARALRRAGRLLRRRRADEPARVRRHGHGLQLLPRRRSVRVRPGGLELGGRARAAARARRPARRGGLLGRRPGVLRAAAGREGARRLLLRLRRQVPPRLDGRDGRRAESRGAGRRVRARRPRLPGRRRPRVAPRRRPLQRLRAGDLGGADQPEHHATLARDRLRLLVLPSVRARRCRRGDRLEPVRGHRALVRARQELLVVHDAREAVARLPRVARRPGTGGGDGRARTRAGARRAHLPHRARRLLSLVGLGVPAGARA